MQEGLFDTLRHQLGPAADVDVSVLGHDEVGDQRRVFFDYVLDVLLRLLSAREGREDLQIGYLGPLFGVVEVVALGAAAKDQNQRPSSILEVLYEAPERSEASAWANHDQWCLDGAWKSE